MMIAPRIRLVVVLACLLPLAGCSEINRVLRPAPIEAPPAGPIDRTLDLPEAFDILEVRYDADLVADSVALREWATVHVFAEHRETGEEVLFVYDLAAPGGQPASVIRFRRTAAIAEVDDVSEDEDPEAETAPAPPRRQW